MKLTRKPMAVAIALACVSLAQHAAAQSSKVMDEVVISGQKVKTADAPTQSVSQTDLAAGRARTSDTASLLQDTPGVSLYGAGGVSSLPAIHGLADDRLRIKVDGMDLIASCPNHMNPALSYIDPSNVGELQVYAGIAPVSAGGDSIGGAIVAKTKDPEFAQPGQGVLTKGEIGGSFRDNNNATSVNLSATMATETFSLTYTGAQSEADNYKAGGAFKNYTATGVAGHTLTTDEVGSTAYKTTNHTLGLAMRQANHLFEIKLGFQDMPYQMYPNQRMDLLNNEQKRVNLRYQGSFDWGKLEARAYHEEVDHYMDFGPDKRWWYGTASNSGNNGIPCAAPSNTCAAGMPMYTKGKTTGASLKADVVLNPEDLLRIGSEFQTYRLDDWWPPSGSMMWPGTYWNINNGQRDRTAVFGEWERRVNPAWTTLMGVRYEQVKTNADEVKGYIALTATEVMGQNAQATAFNAANRAKTDNNVDLTAIARHTHDANLNVDFGYAHKVRSPNLYERYTWSSWTMAAVMNNFVGDGNGYVGNVDLKPEKANTVSATFDWHSSDREWQLRATPHYTLVDDYIDAVAATVVYPTTTVYTASRFNVLKYTNQSARLYGLDLSGQMPLAKTGVGQFGLKGLVSYVKGENRDTHDDLYNIMPLNGKFTLTQKLGGWDNALEVVGVQGKKNVSDVRNEVKTPGYSLINLRTSYSWGKVRLDLGVENLMDRAYSLPLGGAYTGQGRTMSMNPAATDGMFAWGTAVPGMGRSIYAGFNVKF